MGCESRYSERLDQDLPPESANEDDWSVLKNTQKPTNQILRVSFQLLKGSVTAKQIRM